MKVKPVRCVVMIKPDSVEEASEGGIYYPDVTKDRMQSAIDQGTIVAIGEGFYKGLDGPIPKVGDKVIFGRYVGSLVTIKDTEGKRQEYRLCNDNQIVAIIEE